MFVEVHSRWNNSKTFVVEMSSNPLSFVPDWLNSKFVEKHLKIHYKNDEVRVINFIIKCNSEDLGNFASKIFRANVTFSVPSRNKSAAEDEVSSIMLN